jgi:hypothetical protein
MAASTSSEDEPSGAALLGSRTHGWVDWLTRGLGGAIMIRGYPAESSTLFYDDNSVRVGYRAGICRFIISLRLGKSMTLAKLSGPFVWALTTLGSV